MKPLFFLCLALALSVAFADTPVVKPGIEVLRDRNFDLLKGKRVGLVTNPTGVDSRLQSTVDILYHAPGVKLVALFGPEHGVRGEFAAGDRVDSYTDPETKLPVYSLYGRTHKPTPEMLQDIDVLVYDIQDIGVRSYTYIATLGQIMEAAAEQKKQVVVLDRPNPLGGLKAEGTLVEPGFTSFVSPYPVPYVYGLTCGELAKMLNEEKMLTGGIQCSLTVIPMEGWRREMTFEETGLPWVPTSPHVPELQSAQYYVATGIMGELGVFSEGVGYTLPFHLLAAEWIDAGAMANRMNALRLPGVIFRPITFKPFYGRSMGKALHGVQVHLTDYRKADLMGVQFLFMQVHNELYPDKNPFQLADPSRLAMFDKVAGSDQIRLKFSKQMRYSDISGLLAKAAEEFQKKSMRYYLYQK